jgi:CheY-like chemotaxis protein
MFMRLHCSLAANQEMALALLDPSPTRFYEVVNVRIPTESPATHGGGRLNLLLTENRPHAPEHWISQLPTLLRPQGVDSFLARTTSEALELASHRTIHAAVIDLATPASTATKGPETDLNDVEAERPDAGARPARAAAPSGCMWLIELFRRLPDRPSVVVIHSPAYTDKQLERLLHEALRLGAFSVMNKPVQVEQLLTVFQRLLERRYQGAWPGQRRPASNDEPASD